MIYVLLFSLLVIGSLLIFLANLNGKVEVHVSQTYDADIETIFNKLKDFKTWKEWSPWLIHQPECKLEYSNDPTEQDGYYTWEGNIVGSGKLTHTGFDVPNLIKQKLDIFKPFKSSGDIRFELTKYDDKTQVSWIMQSQMPFLFRFMAPKIQQMISQDYKLGLAMLAGALDKTAEHPKIQFIGKVEKNEETFLCKGFEGGIEAMTVAMEQGFPELISYVQEKNVAITAEPRAFYHKADIKKMYFVCDMAIPVNDDLDSEAYEIKKMGAGNYYQIDVMGSYQFLESAWYAAMAHIYMMKLNVDGSRPSVEVYMNDPNEVTHSNQIKTSLLVPIK